MRRNDDDYNDLIDLPGPVVCLVWVVAILAGFGAVAWATMAWFH